MQRRILVCLFLLVLVPFAHHDVLAASTRETVEELLDSFASPLSSVISTWSLGPPGTLGGMPHFSLGVGGSLHLMDYENPFDQENITISLGFPSAQGRIGIFKGGKLAGLEGAGAIDLGFKYGYIPSDIVDIFKEQSTLTGAELRVGILEDSTTTPSVAASITYNSLSGLALEDEDWKVEINASTFGMKILVGKKLPFIHPYGGLGYDWCSVKANYEIDPLNVDEEWERSPSLFRILVGCEFSILPFVKLAGEYTMVGSDSAYGFGLRGGF